MTRNTDDKKYFCCFGCYFGNKRTQIEKDLFFFVIFSIASFPFPISLCCNKKMSEFVNDIAVCDLQKERTRKKNVCRIMAKRQSDIDK